MVMPVRYVRPTFRGWIVPTLVGPLVSVYTTVTFVALLWGDVGTIWRGVGWVAGMVFGTVWAGLYMALLGLVDVALLAVRVRTLPVGRRAWAMALGCPVLIAGVYKLIPPYKFYASGPWGVVLAFLLPMVLVTLVARVAFGTRPPR
jgi:hypothetical protein